MKVLQHSFTTEKQFLEALQDAQIPLNHPHILVQIFDGCMEFNRLQHLLTFIRNTMPHSIVAGVTTDGGIINDQVLEDSLLISVLCFDNTRVRIEKAGCLHNNFFEEGAQLGQKLHQQDLKAVILFGEGISVNGEEFLAGFENEVEDIVIGGGLAGDNSLFSRTYLFFQDMILSEGVVAVGLYSDTLRAASKWTFDCDIIGDQFVVTEVEGNIVYKLGDIPPETLYREHLGLHSGKQFIEICAQVPLVSIRNGEILARAAITRQPGGALGFAGNLARGEVVRFGIANAETMLRNAVAMYNEIDDQWDAIHIFSCTGRKTILGERLAQDIQHFPHIAPVNGFFSYGEFVKEQGKKARFCNQTMVLLFLSESENTPAARPLCEINDSLLLPKTKRDAQKQDTLSQVLQEQFILMEHKNKIQKQLVLIEHKNKIMEEILYKDSLTNLRSRAFLLKELKKKLPQDVLLIDIRNFHTINDLYGESAGNLILQTFADFLRERFNPQDIYRFSGNTFAITNGRKRDLEETKSIARKIVYDVQAENFSFAGEGIDIDCAISVTIGISKENSEEEHLEQADMALNYAKKHNKEIVVYTDSLNIKQEYKDHITTIKMVKKALDDDRIVPFFQPVFEGDKVSYYEALVRLITEDGRILTPFYFLDTIKQTTYYPYLTRRMIKKSFELFQKLNNRVAINLSFLDFLNTTTVEYLFTMIKKYDMGKKLILEILESEIFQDYDSSIEQIKCFRALGAKIAIDDFGSGYSNFQHLTLINPDYMKIDGSLIKNLDKDTNNMAICRAIISFAKDMKMKTVAEFIHSKEILEITTGLKVNKHQGFYLGEPQGAEVLFPNIF